MLRELAVKYRITLTVTRDSLEKDVTKAFRRVSLKAHPDKGGEQADFQKLSAANDAWQDLLKKAAAPGRPPQAGRQRPKAGKPWSMQVPEVKKVFSVRGQAVLLTYPGFSEDLAVLLPSWQQFVSFVESKQQEWGVKFWTATAETNEDAKHHLHLMLQFWKADDKRVSNSYSFEGVLPNASANDLLGEGFGGKRFHSSFLCFPGLPFQPPCRPARPFQATPASPACSRPSTDMPLHTPCRELPCFSPAAGPHHPEAKHKQEV